MLLIVYESCCPLLFVYVSLNEESLSFRLHFTKLHLLSAFLLKALGTRSFFTISQSLIVSKIYGYAVTKEVSFWWPL